MLNEMFQARESVSGAGGQWRELAIGPGMWEPLVPDEVIVCGTFE